MKHTLQPPLLPLIRTGKVLSFVGGGGKTTLIYHIAQACAQSGLQVLVTTTTRIFMPQDICYASSVPEVEALWQEGRFAVIGTPLPEAGKLASPADGLWTAAMQKADLVLVEADGSRHFPIKIPREGEPVIPPESSGVIAVMGLSAIGKPLQECCFRWELAASFLGAGPDHILTETDAVRLLASVEGGRKNTGSRDFWVILNQCDTPCRRESADRIRALLSACGIRQTIITSFSPEEQHFYYQLSNKSAK